MQANLLIGRLHIGYDRGGRRNQPEDLGLEVQPTETQDGYIVRGLGTKIHPDDRTRVNACGVEERRIRLAFRKAFVAAPFDGTFILPKLGAGQALLASLDPPPSPDVEVRVAEYTLGVVAEEPAEMREWSERVTKQLTDASYGAVQLGGGKKVSAEGVAVLEQLAQCPIIAEPSRAQLLELVRLAKLDQIERVDFKRRLATISVEVGAALSPQRAVRPGPERAA